MWSSRDRPALSLFTPWWMDIKEMSLFYSKRFIPASNERVHKFFSYLIVKIINKFCIVLYCIVFSPRMLDYSWPSNRNFMKWQASSYVTPNLHRDWQIADQTFPKVAMLWTDDDISSWPESSPLSWKRFHCYIFYFASSLLKAELGKLVHFSGAC